MLQKALLSVTAREHAQLWGFRLPGRWGIIQKALISATAHEDLQKPFDFAIFGRQWRVCVTGQVSVTKRAAFRKYIRETVQILRRFRTTTAFQLKTKLKLKTDYFAWLSRFSPIRGAAEKKNTACRRVYLKPYTSSDSFRN